MFTSSVPAGTKQQEATVHFLVSGHMLAFGKTALYTCLLLCMAVCIGTPFFSGYGL